MKNLAILVTVSLIAAAAAYFAFVSGDGIEPMTLRLEAGRAVVEREGERIPVEDSLRLKEGDVIRTMDGVATLRLAGRRFAHLNGDARVAVANDHTLDGRGGSLRASSGGDPFKVSFGDVSATTVNGHFRVDQGFGSARVGTYEGSARLSTPGQPTLDVPQFFEASVAVGDLPSQPRPYRFDLDDDWDLQLLGWIIDLDENLTRSANGLSSELELGGSRPNLEYFGALADQNVDFMRRYLQRATDDLLIGFTIADNSRSASLKRAFKKAFSLHDEGGRWGLVAAILDTRPTRLVADLGDLIAATGVAGGDEQGADAPEFTIAAGSEVAPGSGDPSDPTDPSDPPPDDPTDPKDPKDPKDPDPPQDCSNGPECDAQETLDEILPDDDPSPSPDGDDEDGGGGNDPPLTDGVLGGGEGLP